MAEIDRINHVKATQGDEAALAFAERTMKTYRTAVLTSAKRGAGKPHFASANVWKETFIKSYLELKRYVIEQRPGPKLSFEERMAQAEIRRKEQEQAEARAERERRHQALLENVQDNIQRRVKYLQSLKDGDQPKFHAIERVLVTYHEHPEWFTGYNITTRRDGDAVIVTAPFVVGSVCGNVTMYNSETQCIGDLIMRALVIGVKDRKL
jgi:hypothetical protein